MNKKVKFSDKPLSVRIVYIVTLAILIACVCIVTVVSIASRKEPLPESPTPPTEEVPPVEENPEGENKEVAPTFYSPATGSVLTEHATDTPVFSETLKEWRTHSGIDILTGESAPVYAAADGVISAIYDDPFLGRTVELTHSMNYKTVYSNLAKEDAAFISVGDKVALGDRIGTVGYTAIFEIADEPHLHFEMKENDASVDPLAHICDESKETSLGIKKQ